MSEYALCVMHDDHAIDGIAHVVGPFPSIGQAAAYRIAEKIEHAYVVPVIAPELPAPDASNVYPVNNYGLPFYGGQTVACDAPFTDFGHGMCAGCTDCECHTRIDHPHTSRYARSLIEQTLADEPVDICPDCGERDG